MSGARAGWSDRTTCCGGNPPGGAEGNVLTTSRKGAWHQTVTMSDQRLEGVIYQTYESDTYKRPGTTDGPQVNAATWRIENEHGTWESRSVGATFSDGTAMGGDQSMEILVGEGAYAGLTAIMEVTALDNDCGVDVRGIVFDGGPSPEHYIPPGS